MRHLCVLPSDAVRCAATNNRAKCCWPQALIGSFSFLSVIRAHSLPISALLWHRSMMECKMHCSGVLLLWWRRDLAVSAVTAFFWFVYFWRKQSHMQFRHSMAELVDCMCVSHHQHFPYRLWGGMNRRISFVCHRHIHMSEHRAEKPMQRHSAQRITGERNRNLSNYNYILKSD